MSPDPGLKEQFLEPGEIAYGDAKTILKTILGSCVALTFWHPERRVGAMCHYLLPSRAIHESTPLSGRYAEEAIAIVAARFRGMGLRPECFEVKMFGGGNMFPDLAIGDDADIGKKNARLGREFLQRAGFQVGKTDLSGEAPRTVVFDVGSGAVWVRQEVSPASAAGLSRQSGKGGPS